MDDPKDLIKALNNLPSAKPDGIHSMVLEHDIPKDLDKACVSLFKSLNSLPGIKTKNSCCGHGNEPYRIYFDMDSNSIGSAILSRCLSGRYYNYAKDEQRNDPQWRAYISDVEHGTSFVLEGKSMLDDSDLHEPAEKLAKNIMEFVADDFKMAKNVLFDTHRPDGHQYDFIDSALFNYSKFYDELKKDKLLTALSASSIESILQKMISRNKESEMGNEQYIKLCAQFHHVLNIMIDLGSLFIKNGEYYLNNENQ